MSAAQRKAVGVRMKKYWAARRGASETTGTTSSDSAEKASKTARGTAKRGPRNMSPEARKRISDAQKARWAKQRGESKATEASSTTASSPTGRASGCQTPRARRSQARPPQDVRRSQEADFAGAEEAVGGQTEGRLSGSRPGTKRWGRHRMKPDEVAKLVLDIERSVQMRTMLRQKLATNQEVDLVEEWNEIEQLDLEIARKIRKRPIE